MSSFYTQSYLNQDTFKYDETTGLYTNQEETYLTVYDENHTYYYFRFEPGLITDMGSIPSALQWFIPSYDHNNVLLNLAYVAHDFCYGSERLAKPIADDLLRSVLRDAGYDRFHASMVCWCVNNFGNSRYGIKNDRYNCRNFGSMKVL